ncbi:radical SAM protein [Streptomyces sp. NPDC020731]|uniref:radical SAM protein n=1 Tax=Streptomyces sp. NPDC020731 TaxID=3365085 RepID=UPI0037AF7E12
MQFSDLLLTSDSTMRDYYRRSYGRMRGYHMPRHFMEIPYWIPIVSSMLPDERFAKELLVVENLDDAFEQVQRGKSDSVFFFSAMDANIEALLHLARTGATFVVGGYVDPALFEEFPDVHFLHNVEDLPATLPGARDRGILDYRLFRGLECIPRYSLSSGCSLRCKFCTVPTKVVPTDPMTLESEVDALEPLDFRLVFLDDKSFGDAKNWREIGNLRKRFETVNPDFEGFIVQMPPSFAVRGDFLKECVELGVRYVEFGVETANDDLLKYLRKPFRMRHLREACDRVRELGLYLVPNLIMGIPGDDYHGTVEWVREYVDIIPAVNVNWLATHFGNERGDLGLPAETFGDRDQNTAEKTWLSEAEAAAGRDAVELVYSLTDEYWQDRMTYPQERVVR